MGTYVLSLLSASLVAAVAELLSPKGEGGRIASHVRMVAGLFLLVALLNPIKEGVEILREASAGGLTARMEELLSGAEAEGYEGVFDESLTRITAEEAEAYVVSVLESDFSVPPSGCRVSVLCTYGDTVTICEVRIALLGVYVTRDPHPIEDYFQRLWSCPCFVTVGGGDG